MTDTTKLTVEKLNRVEIYFARILDHVLGSGDKAILNRVFAAAREAERLTNLLLRIYKLAPYMRADVINEGLDPQGQLKKIREAIYDAFYAPSPPVASPSGDNCSPPTPIDGECQQTGGEEARLKRVIEHDRSIVATGVTNLKRAIARRRWLLEDGRGSYSYDDEEYKKEFGAAIEEIDAAMQPLRELAGNLSDSPTSTKEIAMARQPSPSTGDSALAEELRSIIKWSGDWVTVSKDHAEALACRIEQLEEEVERLLANVHRYSQAILYTQKHNREALTRIAALTEALEWIAEQYLALTGAGSIARAALSAHKGGE